MKLGNQKWLHIHSENLHHIQEYEFVFRGARKGPASAATSVKMKQKRGVFYSKTNST